MSDLWQWAQRMRDFHESAFLPGLGADAFCAWCGELMPSMSLGPHQERQHAAILQANREWEWSNPL